MTRGLVRTLRWASAVVVVGLLLGVGLAGRWPDAAGPRRSATSAMAAADVAAVGPRRLPASEVAAAIERTTASGSARIDATYRPAIGPPVTVTGRISLVGPGADVSAAVGDEAPAQVRVTADGSWLRPPGATSWTPVATEQVAAAAAARGWSGLLQRVDGSSEAWTDGRGRITRVRLARDRQGGTLDLRLSGFGVEVPTVPP